MTRDTLDDLLDGSAPTTLPAARADLAMMAADARRATRKSVRSRLAVAVAIVAILTSGGVGMAAATGVFSWAPWAQQPIGAVQFTMSTGFECEMRFSEYTGGADPAYVAEINRSLEDWYRSTDVLAAVKESVPARLEALGPIELLPGETLDTLPPGEADHREWVRNWLAWELAIGDAETQQLSSRGFEPGDARMAGSERSGQINCLDQDGQPYAPRAGS